MVKLNEIINELKIAFQFNDGITNSTAVFYWLNAYKRIYKLSNSQCGYILYNLKKAKAV